MQQEIRLLHPMRSNDFLQSDWRCEEKVHQITPEKREEGKEEAFKYFLLE